MLIYICIQVLNTSRKHYYNFACKNVTRRIKEWLSCAFKLGEPHTNKNHSFCIYIILHFVWIISNVLPLYTVWEFLTNLLTNQRVLIKLTLTSISRDWDVRVMQHENHFILWIFSINAEAEVWIFRKAC